MAVIIDLEATCSTDGSVPRHEMEIIEIGAVVVLDGTVIDEFTEFIRPVRHPHLTAFCTELTSITQDDVDAAETFTAVAKRFGAFVESHRRHGSPSDWWGSWGLYDANQLARDVAVHRGIDPLPMPHRNLKEEFTSRQQLGKRPGLGSAITLAGLEFVGTPHRGIDDARNIARLLPWIDGTDQLDSARVQQWKRSRQAKRR